MPEIEITSQQRQRIEQWIEYKTGFDHKPVVYTFGDQAHNVEGEPIVLYTEFYLDLKNRKVSIVGDRLLTSNKILAELEQTGIISREGQRISETGQDNLRIVK